MTPAEIIYQRRIAVLDHAARTGNVAETCRIFGISRTRYYQWKKSVFVLCGAGIGTRWLRWRREEELPLSTNGRSLLLCWGAQSSTSSTEQARCALAPIPNRWRAGGQRMLCVPRLVVGSP